MTIIFVGIGAVAYQRERTLKADFEMAQQASRSCGLPSNFVRLDDKAGRFEKKIKAGAFEFGCRPDWETTRNENEKMSCFTHAMANKKIEFDSSSINDFCGIPPPPIPTPIVRPPRFKQPEYDTPE